MGDRLKSAYELAMEKLTRKDRESPVESTAARKLTARQKKKITEIRRDYQAKLAEREILFKSERRAAKADPEQIEKIEESYRRDRERLLSSQEVKLRRARGEGPPES